MAPADERTDSRTNRPVKNSFLNFVKGCACICVVWIHVQFPASIGAFIGKIGQSAVFIFFMISGYFAYGAGCKKIILRTKRIFRIAGYALVLFILTRLCFYPEEILSSAWAIKLASWGQWVKILVFSDFDIIGAGALWFLPALGYAYIVLYLIEKKNLYRYAYQILPVLFAIMVAVFVAVDSFDLSWHLRGNVFVSALPWVLFGNYAAHSQEFRSRFSDRMLILSILGGTLLVILCGMIKVFGNAFQLLVDPSWIGITVISASLFLLAVNHPELSLNRGIEKLGETYSLYVYILHLPVNTVIKTCAAMLGQQDTVWYQFANPILVAAASVLLGIVIHQFVFSNSR